MNVFVDTNILIYRRDPRDPTKQKLAYDWIAALGGGRTGRLSWQVLQEFFVNAIRKLENVGLTAELARSDVRLLSQWSPPATDLALIELAWRMQDRHQFSWWDALIVAAALRQECSMLISEDMQHGLVIDNRLTLINPFAPDAPLPSAAS